MKFAVFVIKITLNLHLKNITFIAEENRLVFLWRCEIVNSRYDYKVEVSFVHRREKKGTSKRGSDVIRHCLVLVSCVSCQVLEL